MSARTLGTLVRAHTTAIFLSFVTGLLGIIVGATIENGNTTVFSGLYSYFISNPNALSAIGTLFLVLLTGLYTVETRKLVETEYQVRKDERIESWYGDTLTIVRKIDRNWRFLLRNRAPDGRIKLYENEEIYIELQEQASKLEAQIAGRPKGVEPSLVDKAESFFDTWKLLIQSESPTLEHDNNCLTHIEKIESDICEQSDWYGKKDNINK
jgi:hypothetical protein